MASRATYFASDLDWSGPATLLAVIKPGHWEQWNRALYRAPDHRERPPKTIGRCQRPVGSAPAAAATVG